MMSTTGIGATNDATTWCILATSASVTATLGAFVSRA
jgi:hypothetical protein